MEISGIDINKLEATKGYKNLKNLAVEIIASYGIEIESNDFDKAYKRMFETTKGDKTTKKCVLTVSFKDLEKKLEVLEAKKTKPNLANIFFGAALTPQNRYFMARAKAIASKKIKVYFGRGSVRAVKKDNVELVIDEDKKLEELKYYVESLPTNI
jgi:hypothetical protein